jgi:hypothetical protein
LQCTADKIRNQSHNKIDTRDTLETPTPGKTSKEGFIISASADPENKYTNAKPSNLLYTEIQLQSEQI